MSNWCIYLIWSSTINRTYIGASTNVARRLRQHNGLIKGGARSTRRTKDWKLICYVSGFANKSEAYRWEKLVKARERGLCDRELAMYHLVVSGLCPGLARGKQEYPVPTGLQYHTGEVSE